MKVLFFEPFGNYTPHFETCLELMQRHLDDGDEVHFRGCDGELPACEPNWQHKPTTCLSCVKSARKGLSLLSKQVHFKSFYCMTRNQKREFQAMRPNCYSVEALKKICYQDFDIGMGALSSFMHRTKDVHVSGAQNEDFYNRLLEAGYIVYRSFQNILEKTKFDRIYIFNGRFSSLRGVLRLCQEKGIECYVHERGSNKNKFMLYKNQMPHNINHVFKMINSTWSDSQDSDKEKIAQNFYIARSAGKEDLWYAYTENQQKGLLPEGWNKNKINIVIFNSSEHEFGAIGDEWTNPVYESQAEGVRAIAQDLSKKSDKYDVYLRMHPNLQNVCNESIEALKSIKHSNFKLLLPGSEVDTYNLIRNSDKVVTFGSTVGIEAAFWGKISILAGMSFYRDLGSVYLPKNHGELIELLTTNVEPLSTEGALKYSYYLKTFGEEFKYYRPDELHEGSYKGVYINRNQVSIWEKLLARFKSICLKKV